MIETTQLGVLSVEAKRELLKTLLSLRDGGATGTYPLSPGQQGLWFVYQLAPNSPAYNFLFAARLPADTDLDALTEAFQDLLVRHPALRSRFFLKDGKPTQKVEKTLGTELLRVDACDWSWEDLLRRLEQRADVPFDLEQGPALRAEFYTRPNETILLLVFHHIVADLWSMDLLVEELKELYVARKKGKEPSLPAPRGGGFGDYLRHQLTTLHGPRGQQALAYWLKELGGTLPVLDLPTDRPRPAVQSYRGAMYTWPIASATLTRLRSLSGQLGTTLFPVLLGAFEVLLHRYSGQSDLLVGVTTADRSRPEWERLVGYLLNQVVLRGQLTPQMPFLDLVQQVRDRLYHALEHQDCPFGELVKKLQPHRDPSRSPVFQTMFIWDRPRALPFPRNTDPKASPASGCPGLVLEPLKLEQRGAPCDLSLIVFETEELTARFCYNTDLFDRSTIERMAHHLDTLLDTVARAPRTPLADIPMLLGAERTRLLEEFARSPAQTLPAGGFLTLFERHAASSPEAIALEQEDQRLSYRELNEQANRLARLFQKHGVEAGDIVAIHMPRRPEMIVALLAAWKLRAAWLYLEPAHPAPRLQGMLADARPALILTAGQSPDPAPKALRLEDAVAALAKFEGSNLGLAPQAEDWAYIIYTSGSTGKPKGTILLQRGLVPLWQAQKEFFRLEPTDRVMLFASMSFDASVYEMLMGLGTGARLVLPTPSSVLPGPGLAQLLREKRVTVATLPPSILQAIPQEPFSDLRLITVAGEPCPAELVTRWGLGRRLINAYGPTEATVCATWTETTPDGKAPSIGRPMAQTRAYIVDTNSQPVPVGVPGELLLAGPGLALGYLEQPGLTAERFLPSPFGEGEVVYCTGDLVRWRPDGQIDFLGRLDHQVKLRGHRIELDEVREVLRQHPAVADAAVILREEGTKAAALAAYVVPRGVPELPIDALREFLRGRLPAYMLPATITPLDSLPLTGYGKVDRKALARIVPRTGGGSRPQTPPRTPAEKTLARIWCRVLGLDTVGIHDNFFDLGGSSVQTVEVVSLAADAGLTLTPELLFRAQTIADIAEQLSSTEFVPTSSTTTESVSPALTNGKAASNITGTPGALIESLGVYLPNNVLTTDEVLSNCKSALDFPLERFTGIRSRRVAGENEFSIDLARKAVTKCLARSKYSPADVDLLVCANISRYDGPNWKFSIEPTTASRLQREFGLVNALAFDLTNACAGTFTAIWFADMLLRQGAIRNALVVSGEYISHLTRTAQLEIQDFTDPRMACLTLGDAGQAVLLERASRADVGFHDLELFTVGKHHPLCVAKMTYESHGGAIMYTDPVKSAVVTTKLAVGHCLEMLSRNHWSPESIRQLIMHQTSERTLDGAVQEINRVLGKQAVHKNNTVYNLAERGNCATNTHLLATYENIQSGRIQPGDQILYAVSGSGLVVGSAIYTFDDFPERSRSKEEPARLPPTDRSPLRTFRLQKPVKVESLGEPARASDTIAMLREAGESCLGRSSVPRNDIDLVLHSGVHRSEFLSEPALAAIVAGELGINHDDETNLERRSFAFDVMNGALGTLSACFVASSMMQTGKMKRALVMASEVEPNALTWPENLVGVRPTATGFVLEPSQGEGFFAFGFRAFPEHVDCFESHTAGHDGKPVAQHRSDPALDTVYLECAATAVAEFLRDQKLSIADVALVLPSWRSPGFVAELGDRLGVPADRVIGLEGTTDWFTSSLAAGLRQAREQGRPARGEVILVVEVGAGVQVACALYRG